MSAINAEMNRSVNADGQYGSVQWLDKSFADALDWGAAQYGEREAVVYCEQRITFEQFARRVRAFARGLIELGVAPGEKVALWMSDLPEWLIARWAVPAIGAILVPVNTRFRATDVKYVLEQSDAGTLIIQEGGRGTSYFDILGQIHPAYCEESAGQWYSDTMPFLRRVIGLACKPDRLPASMSSFEGIEAAGAALLAQSGAGGDKELASRLSMIKGDDIAQILYTSGTTSFPKGAMVCHGALLQNNANAAGCLELSPNDKYLSCVPLFTATGTFYTLASWLSGAVMVIVDYFDPKLFCEMVQSERITVSFFVDTIVQDLKAFGRTSEYDLSSLRTGTGAPLPKPSFCWVTTELGVPELVSAYGMSETSNAVVRTLCSDPLDKRSGTNGRPVPGVEIRIADAVTNKTMDAGVIGEICIRGYVLMKGYYKMPDEDRKVFDEQGWLHSGDLGELDEDGYLIYRGRVKEMIKPGGFNVATQEIEQFLKSYPGVKQVAVVGVPDTRLGEVGYAYIEQAEGVALSETALKAYCKEHIASYKVPRFIEFIDEWPLTGSQKIRKLELKERAHKTLKANRGET